MTLYKIVYEPGKFDPVGYVDFDSIYNPTGPSHVRIYPEFRKRFGLPKEPYEWRFDTYRQAIDWADNALNGVHVGF